MELPRIPWLHLSSCCCFFMLMTASMLITAHDGNTAPHQSDAITTEIAPDGDPDQMQPRPAGTNGEQTETNQTSPYKITLFQPEEGESGTRLWSQTKLVAGLGPAVAGVIALLPEDISKWDTSNHDPLLERWWDNVREGPVWDDDKWYINYIGHPYFGGVYYQVARKSGYNQWNSFIYSALMSTFYWEYGLEAFAEVPSIQDLVVTPVGGWLYGEWAHNKEKEIRAAGGRVWGSKTTGSIALFLLDPVDMIGTWVNTLCKRDVVKTGYFTVSRLTGSSDNEKPDSTGWMVTLTFTY